MYEFANGVRPKSKTFFKFLELHKRQNFIDTQSFFCTIYILRLFFLLLVLAHFLI